MRKFTLATSPISVTNVEKPLARSHTSPSMRKFTLGTSPISVTNVEKPLAGYHTSAGIRPLTREESFEVKELSQKSNLRKRQRMHALGKYSV
jgi:hypothetical protein